MFKRFKGKGHWALTAAALAAFAGNASAVIDTTSITASISEGQVAGVTVSVAFAVAVWAIRSIALARRG